VVSGVIRGWTKQQDETRRAICVTNPSLQLVVLSIRENFSSLMVMRNFHFHLENTGRARNVAIEGDAAARQHARVCVCVHVTRTCQ